jgi:RNA polymerase sigma-70 factor (ECF subfamily)
MDEITAEEIRQIQGGNSALFARVMALYKQKVANLCFKYMRNTEEAADMAQEVFSAVFISIKRFEFKSKFSTWLYRIAVNNCINKLKSLKRRGALERATDSPEEIRDFEMSMLADKGKLADEQLELMELKDKILTELEGCTDMERNLVILKDMEGFSVEEISGILNLPVGTVKSLAARTREKIRKNMFRKMGDKLGM